MLGIFTPAYHENQHNVGKYASPMDLIATAFEKTPARPDETKLQVSRFNSSVPNCSSFSNFHSLRGLCLTACSGAVKGLLSLECQLALELLCPLVFQASVKAWTGPFQGYAIPQEPGLPQQAESSLTPLEHSPNTGVPVCYVVNRPTLRRCWNVPIKALCWFLEALYHQYQTMKKHLS